MRRGYSVHFEGLTAEKLHEIEAQCEETSAVNEYVEGLLMILAEWKRDVAWYPLMRSEYERALNATREAWLLWSFQGQGNEWLPESFDLPGAPQKGADR